MKTKIRHFAAALAALLVTTASQAAVFRAYLSSSGNDANPCTLQQPCRLLPAALAAVQDGGEVWMMDSANFNTATVTVAKSVSILAIPGAVGSVVAIGGPAIQVLANDLTVALRNVVIAPFPGGFGTFGIVMSGSSTLHVEGSLIANLPSCGICLNGLGRLKVANSIIRNNGDQAVSLLNGASGEISNTKMVDNFEGGVLAWSRDAAVLTTATVSDCVISGKSRGATANNSLAGGVSRVLVTRTTIEGTGSALVASANVGSALVVVSGSMITNNFASHQIGGGAAVVRSMGNNHIAENTTSAGTMTFGTLQ